MTAPGRSAPVAPALGPLPSLARRAVVLRIGAVVCLLALAVLARNSGVLREQPTDSALPPVPGVALVLPDVLRGGAPSDTELVQLHDSYRVRAVVAVGGASAEEQAVARDLGIPLLQLDVDDRTPPAPERVLELVRFVRETTDEPNRRVYLHDATGSGPGLITTAAMLQVLEDPAALDDVLDGLDAAERIRLGAARLTAIEAVADAAAGERLADNPYAPLREAVR